MIREMRVVSNTSPLISLAILGHLDLLSLIFTEGYVPQAVFDEASAWGKPYSRQLKQFTQDKSKPVQNKLAVQLLSKDIDLGEAEVIALALETGIEDVLLDDFKGRQLARLHGLSPIGTIGVLLQAKKAGHINELKPNLDKLIANRTRIGANLYQQALQLADDDLAMD